MEKLQIMKLSSNHIWQVESFSFHQSLELYDFVVGKRWEKKGCENWQFIVESLDHSVPLYCFRPVHTFLQFHQKASTLCTKVALTTKLNERRNSGFPLGHQGIERPVSSVWIAMAQDNRTREKERARESELSTQRHNREHPQHQVGQYCGWIAAGQTATPKQSISKLVQAPYIMGTTPFKLIHFETDQRCF